jgi:acetoacetyl-CoA reductase/3-oxoacyl-[acyl-carrier protein] reductase
MAAAEAIADLPNTELPNAIIPNTDREQAEDMAAKTTPEFDFKDALGLEGRVILVTGGNRGIGKRIVLLLEQLGAKVAYTDRSDRPSTHGSLALTADVTYPSEMEAAVERVEKELGPIYGVVANAGVTRDAMFHKMTHRDWDQAMAINLTGVYNTIRPVFPLMRERGEGSFVFISSIIGEQGGIGQVNYSVTKAGLIGMARSLAREGAFKNVRANVVAPGFVETEMTGKIPAEVREKITADIPMRRFADPMEIAWPLVNLLSPKAGGFMTGAIINVNGGQRM